MCSKCGGNGTIGNKICPQCHGTGRDIIETKRFDVTIPERRPRRPAHRLALPGRSGETTAGPTGISFSSCTWSMTPCASERKGDDLYLDLPVSIYDESPAAPSTYRR